MEKDAANWRDFFLRLIIAASVFFLLLCSVSKRGAQLYFVGLNNTDNFTRSYQHYRNIASNYSGAQVCSVASNTSEVASSANENSGYKVNDTFLAWRELIYRQRQAHLEKHCLQLQASLKKHLTRQAFFGHVFWHYGYHMTICTIPKVGSTTWVNYLIQLIHVPRAVTKTWRFIRLKLGEILYMRMKPG